MELDWIKVKRRQWLQGTRQPVLKGTNPMTCWK
jgi:hypothetical protein